MSNILKPELAKQLKASAKRRKKRARRDKLILRVKYGCKLRCLRWYRKAQHDRQEKQRQADSSLYGAFA